MTDEAPYLTFRRWMLDRYGVALRRVPVDFGFGCPHRAPDGSGGCSYCAENGARAVYVPQAGLEEQVRAGVDFARRRYGAERFLAYVQAHTGTFAPAGVLRERFERLLGCERFDALAVATRPDCLPDETLDVLAELRGRLDVWVEVGVQTTHDDTLRRIRRGHDWETARRALERLAERGLRPAAHVILGLPGEDPARELVTADRLAALPVQGVKIHNLHVIRGTALEREYAEQPFPLLDETAHLERTIAFLRRIPAAVAVLRLNTDTPSDELLAPEQAFPKSRFLERLVREMRRRGARQGDCVGR